MKCQVLCLMLLAYGNAGPSRILGGHDTTIEARPYQASLQNNSKHYCGASIISTKFLLTAAHCKREHGDYSLTAVVGTNNFTSEGQILNIGNFTVHPKSKSNSYAYDFAILSFADDEEIILGPQVDIIKLAEPGDDPAVGSMATVSGWGFINDKDHISPKVLQEVDIPVWDNDKCAEIYHILTPQMMCLGGLPEGGVNACIGDSGGPLVQGDPKVLYGIVSGGMRCSSPNIPTIFGRVSMIRPWIEELTGV